ncbi:hypothetical protein [uncultured Dialister sp.]|uniref:hypothetical protein n=1 Tax=uncultured Dialister sp. TaxID=278064 RepID=UPI0025974366|nr:hypothetical protein [uncultured Dialister sp.]
MGPDKRHRLEVISGLGRYSLEYDGPFISYEEAKRLYQSADDETLRKAFQTGEPREYEQLKIMEKLSEIVRGLRFGRISK